MILFDVMPPSVLNPIGISIAIGFFLILMAVAFIAFKMLKRTMKMAVRMMVVAVILAVALVGSIALFFGFGKTQPEYRRPQRPSANSSR